MVDSKGLAMVNNAQQFNRTKSMAQIKQFYAQESSVSRYIRRILSKQNIEIRDRSLTGIIDTYLS